MCTRGISGRGTSRTLGGARTRSTTGTSRIGLGATHVVPRFAEGINLHTALV